MADGKRLHIENAITLGGAAILVGTELVGVSWAAGWALGGMFGFPPVISRAVEILGVLIGLALVYSFIRAALRHEPLRS